jgi:hypothetical protein
LSGIKDEVKEEEEEDTSKIFLNLALQRLSSIKIKSKYVFI